MWRHHPINARAARSASLSALLVVLGFGAANASPAFASSASDASLARSLNVKSSDLPKGSGWTTSTVAATPATLGAKAIACIRKGAGPSGKASPDLFGTVGKPSGSVTADVTSPMFGQKGSFTQLPAVNSETAIVSSATQALTDLNAIGAATTRACLATLYAGVTSSQSGGGKANATASSLALPHFGVGSGGVHDRFIVQGSGIPGKVYLDLYFYVVGRAEISITYTNLGGAFSTSWANSIATNVMKRAKATVK